MNTSVIEDASEIRGVEGATAIDASGDVSASSIESPELNEFFRLLFGIAPKLESSTELGPIRGITVRTDRGEDLSLFLSDKDALGIVSGQTRPLKEVKAEVDELLFWV